MTIWVRVNHVGWVHIWRSREAFEAAEPSLHFVPGQTDPRWRALVLTPAQREVLATGGLVEIEDPGYLDVED